MTSLRQTGAELVALSPQLPEHNAKIAKRHKLDFAVLSDGGNKTAQQWGPAHPVDGNLRAAYETMKLDLSRFNGEGPWSLPVPSRFILGQEHQILWVSSDPDYTRRPEPDETIEFLKQLS